MRGPPVPVRTSRGAQDLQAQVVPHRGVAQDTALGDAQHLEWARARGAGGSGMIWGSSKRAVFARLHRLLGLANSMAALPWPDAWQHTQVVPCSHLANGFLRGPGGGGGESQNALRLHRPRQRGAQPEVGGPEGVAPLWGEGGGPRRPEMGHSHGRG